MTLRVLQRAAGERHTDLRKVTIAYERPQASAPAGTGSPPRDAATITAYGEVLVRACPWSAAHDFPEHLGSRPAEAGARSGPRLGADKGARHTSSKIRTGRRPHGPGDRLRPPRARNGRAPCEHHESKWMNRKRRLTHV